MIEIQKAFGRALLDPTDSEHEPFSEYEPQLVALASSESYLDAERLPIWTHNLVTIRFEFEMKQGHGNQHPLPAVFHKLCVLLANVLCGMHNLIGWHDLNGGDCENDIDTHIDRDLVPEETRTEIRNQLLKRRASIWNACIQSIDECLEEYTKCSGKKKLFSKETPESYDANWREDLEGLHDVWVLKNQFLSLGPLVLEGVPEEVINDGSLIEDKLLSCCKVHLRTFHVEAMNTLGMMFYREDWKLHRIHELLGKEQHHHQQQPPPSDRSSSEGGDRSDTGGTLWSTLESIAEQLRHREPDNVNLRCRSRCNGFTSADMSLASLLVRHRNPFQAELGRTSDIAASDEGTRSISWRDERLHAIIDLFKTHVGGDDAFTSKIVLKSVFEGVLPWKGRLLLILEKLPVLAEEASKVMMGIVDLYVTTAFRLCAGNAKNERILLGIDGFYDAPKQSPATHGSNTRSTSQMFADFGLRSSQGPTNRPAPSISPTAEAELCALVPEESGGLESLREFMLESKKRMEGVAKLDLVNGWITDPVIREDTIVEDFAEETVRVLELRQGASSNHLVLALGFFAAIRDIPASYRKLHEYAERLLGAVPLLVTLCHRMSCMRAIRGSSVLREIVSVGNTWAESKLHEHSNGYVDEFCDFLALLWRYLYARPERLPMGIMKILWENLVGGGYMVLLDGFSKIPFCSTEGRALMSMDVASYRTGIAPRSVAKRLGDNDHPTCPLPNDVQPYRTVAYVDTYVKLFYFPSKDAMEWIKGNFRQYHQHHIMALVMNDRDAKNLMKQVLKCYGGARDSVATTMRL